MKAFFPPALLVRLREACSPRDVKLLLCGTEEIDINDWKTYTEYDAGSASTLTAFNKQVEWFWVIVAEMSSEERARLLDFATGSSRPPATGFANLMGYAGNQQRFRIMRSYNGQNYLPTASTCFNTLKLPMYKTKKTLRAKLLAAISEAEGFDERAVAT